MTKEEAIEIIEYTFLNADGHLKPLDFDYGSGKGIVEALKMATKALSALSLPSNLDEAAEEYANDEMMSGLAERAFKAGAGWMAGQGETHELTVESPILGPPMICCPVHADNGDKVVVQIRKK